MNIDWSKAPEDATHCLSGRDFFKLDNLGRVVLFINGSAHNTLNHIGDFLSSSIVERPKKQGVWDGDGLPPVGVICEHEPYEMRNDPHKVEIIAHKKASLDVAVFWDEERQIVSYSSYHSFRPIKTAEQLAEEEKKKAIDDMQRIYEESMMDYSSRLGHASRPAIKALYEAGYRKQ